MKTELGTIDGWRTSIEIEDHFIAINANSDSAGSYRAIIGYDARISTEHRIMADKTYNPHPETARPNMWRIIDAMPASMPILAEILKRAYSYNTGEGQ